MGQKAGEGDEAGVSWRCPTTSRYCWTRPPPSCSPSSAGGGVVGQGSAPPEPDEAVGGAPDGYAGAAVRRTLTLVAAVITAGEQAACWGRPPFFVTRA